MTYRNGIGAVLNPVDCVSNSTASPSSGKDPALSLCSPQDISFWFGEDQARYVVTTKNSAELLKVAESLKIPATIIGKTQSNELTIAENSIKISDLKSANESWLPDYMK